MAGTTRFQCVNWRQHGDYVNDDFELSEGQEVTSNKGRKYRIHFEPVA